MRYFFDDMININNDNPNNKKVDQKFGDVTPNSVNPQYIIINIVNKYVHEHNREDAFDISSY